MNNKHYKEYMQLYEKIGEIQNLVNNYDNSPAITESVNIDINILLNQARDQITELAPPLFSFFLLPEEVIAFYSFEQIAAEYYVSEMHASESIKQYYGRDLRTLKKEQYTIELQAIPMEELETIPTIYLEEMYNIPKNVINTFKQENGIKISRAEMHRKKLRTMGPAGVASYKKPIDLARELGARNSSEISHLIEEVHGASFKELKEKYNQEEE